MESEESRRFEAERRWAQEDLEREADTVDRQRAELGDLATTLAQNRAVVRVAVAGRSFEGEALHAGKDLLTVAHGSTFVDVRLPTTAEIRVIERGTGQPPRELSSHPTRFVGRLNEAHALDSEVELGGWHLDLTPAGRVQIVATDHVELRTSDGGDRIIPLDAIDYIVRRSEAAGRQLR